MKSGREDDFALDRLIIDASIISPPPHHIHPWENMRELTTRSGIINFLAFSFIFSFSTKVKSVCFVVLREFSSCFFFFSLKLFHLEIVFFFLKANQEQVGKVSLGHHKRRMTWSLDDDDDHLILIRKGKSVFLFFQQDFHFF